jgi:hypothetical protein
MQSARLSYELLVELDEKSTSLEAHACEVARRNSNVPGCQAHKSVVPNEGPAFPTLTRGRSELRPELTWTELAPLGKTTVLPQAGAPVQVSDD